MYGGDPPARPREQRLTRRSFLKAAGLSAAALYGIAPELSASRAPLTVAPMRILILGGTGFIGPSQVRYAVERGHTVTVFNRGRRQADLPRGVEHLQGDRNNDLQSLKGREWDVVIDNPTTLPVWVRDAASLLKDAAQHYIFISTISVYGDTSRRGMDEETVLAQYTGADPMAETNATLSQDPALYGQLKALSEREAETWFPGRTTVIRPGLIVGPGDPSDRFTYWPVRIARGGEVLVPGEPNDPVQYIDARDLAEWTIRMAEDRVIGTFNATGPATRMGMRQMLEGMSPLAEQAVTLTQVATDFVLAQGLNPWSDLPVWVPPQDEMEGFAQVSIRRALDRGLTFRPLLTTARDTLGWFRTLPAERQVGMISGITAAREAEVLAAWHSRRR